MNAAAQAAYTLALAAANASGEAPGLDGWWAVLKAAEAAEAAALAAPPSSTDTDTDTDTAGDSDEWAAYTRDYHGAKRWSRAHRFVMGGSVAVCGADPGPAVEWAHEGDTRTAGRCKRCCA